MVPSGQGATHLFPGKIAGPSKLAFGDLVLPDVAATASQATVLPSPTIWNVQVAPLSTDTAEDLPGARRHVQNS